MAIYAKKNAKGTATGLWVIEVTVNGKRVRESTRDHRIALDRERALLAGAVTPKATPCPASLPASPRGYTVDDLKMQAVVVWRGTKDERQSVTRFVAVCDILGLATPLASVRTTQLDRVVDTLRSRSLSNKTIHRYLAAFSGALRWATSRDHIAGMPIIPWPECGKGNDTVISENDERRVLQRLQKVGSPDVALVMDVLLATGCRVGELLALETGDIGNDEVTFQDTKNDDDRTVPLEPALAAKLKALSLVGFPTYRRINTSMHSARKALGIEHKVTPHVMRHTVGTRLSDAGVEVPTIGKILGHRNIKTTMGYIHPEKAAVQRAATHLVRGQPRADEGKSRGQSGGNHPSDAASRMVQPIEKMEASPRIELGFEDLQSSA
jgi:integrase